MKKIVSLCLIIMVMTGCTTSNEDPTNIELEVLRVSLLEKELRIDELQDSISEQQEANEQLTDQLLELENALEISEAQKVELLDGGNQILTIQKDKEHFFDVYDGSLYILNAYSDTYFNYNYEELRKYTPGEPETLIYRGTDIQYLIDSGNGRIIILDQDILNIFDENLELIYEENIDLNDPLIELTPNLYLYDRDYGRAYVLMTKYIEEDQESLLAFMVYDYRNIEEIQVEKYYMNAKSYEINNDKTTLLYEEGKETGNYLYELDLISGELREIALNPQEAFDIHKENGYIYYFHEESGDIIMYDND